MSYKVDTTQACERAKIDPRNVEDAYYILAHPKEFTPSVVRVAEQTEDADEAKRKHLEKHTHD